MLSNVFCRVISPLTCHLKHMNTDSEGEALLLFYLLPLRFITTILNPAEQKRREQRQKPEGEGKHKDSSRNKSRSTIFGFFIFL